MTLERPMFPPVDPTRRWLLSVAAGGAVAAAASATTAQANDTPDDTDPLRVGSLELDPVNRTARRGDRSFDLRRCESRLLEEVRTSFDARKTLGRCVALQIRS